MRVLPSAVTVRTAAVLAVCGPLVVACGGGDEEPLSSPGDRPAEITAEPEQVDACTLVTPEDVDRLLDRAVDPTTLEYGAAQVPTLTCGLGDEFGVAEVSARLATGPISLNVFEDAYGPPAGGTPDLIKKLGERAYLRNEKDQLQIHALVNGAILTLTVSSSTADPVERSTVVELAHLAADRLPKNPRLMPTSAGATCTKLDTEVLTGAIGTEPSVVSSLAGPADSLMCSWSARPGSVVVTVLRESDRVASYRRLLDDDLYTEVEAVGGAGVRTWSRTDKAGDLLVFAGDDAMAVINVVPTAGYASAELPTTAGEIALGTAVVDRLLLP